MLINQSHTAIDCFYSGRINKANQVTQILLCIADGGDYTIGEIARDLHLEKSTVSARRAELLAREWVKKGDCRKCKISGVWCETIILNIGL